jgi:glutamine synthetase
VSVTPWPEDAASALAQCQQWAREDGLRYLRVVWVDGHGHARSKWLTPAAWPRAWAQGLSMVSTLALKDAADRTAWPVFSEAREALPAGLQGAQNLLAVLRPESLRRLPWAPGHAWVMADLRHDDGQALAFDARAALAPALTRLQTQGWGLRVGLELEFHAYRILDASDALNPNLAAWPAPPPRVAMLHPGYQLLSDAHADANALVLDTAAVVADGLGLPLSSMEVEMGPSQFEAVFEVMDAMAAADAMQAFRIGLRQALARQGVHVSFMCRPPFDTIMSSGWHLHHSLVDGRGDNAFCPSAASSDPLDAAAHLSPLGQHWLAGLLAQADALAACGVPTSSGYARFGPNALAPQSAVWGVDNRGAMLRVVGQGASVRIENRVNEPAANPHLVMAAHIAAGLDGVARRLAAPAACCSPYDGEAAALPSHMREAMQALATSSVMREALGAVVEHYTHIKRVEAAQCAAAASAREWEACAYFSRL